MFEKFSNMMLIPECLAQLLILNQILNLNDNSKKKNFNTFMKKNVTGLWHVQWCGCTDSISK